MVEVTKKKRQEDMHHTPCTSDSVPGSSDSLSTEITEEGESIIREEEDSDTDAAVTDHEEEEDSHTQTILCS